jgi:hypothetical protein
LLINEIHRERAWEAEMGAGWEGRGEKKNRQKNRWGRETDGEEREREKVGETDRWKREEAKTGRGERERSRETETDRWGERRHRGEERRGERDRPEKSVLFFLRAHLRESKREREELERG